VRQTSSLRARDDKAVPGFPFPEPTKTENPFFVPWQKQQSLLQKFQNWLSESPQSALHAPAENPGKERFCFPIQRVHLGAVFVLQDIFPTLKRLLTKTGASKKNKIKDSIECKTCLINLSCVYGITFIVALSKQLQQEQFQEI
jgi:hypothetical protein